MFFEEYLKKFTLLHPKSIDLSLGRTITLLEKLGNPHKKLPPIIHIGGTNGKGSVVAFMRSILNKSGYKVQTYTSPHLIRFNERIRLANGLISDSYLKELLEECYIVNKGEKITFFEITTVAAFLAFSRNLADILIMEVGLGGRFDSTNTIDSPILSAITPISLDHTGFLGKNLSSIAYEKAGIIRPNTPIVLSEQNPESDNIILNYANKLGAKVIKYGINWKITKKEHNKFLVSLNGKKISFLKPSLQGNHQILNAAQAAICCANLKNFSVSAENIEEGITKTNWPARMQPINDGKIKANVPSSCELWIDGGHNPAASNAIAETITTWNKEKMMKTFVIIGMMRTKNVGDFIRPLTIHINTFIAIPIPNEDSCHKPKNIVSAIENLGSPCKEAKNIFHALETLTNYKSLNNSRIIICGSLYLAGYILKVNGNKIF